MNTNQPYQPQPLLPAPPPHASKPNESKNTKLWLIPVLACGVPFGLLILIVTIAAAVSPPKQKVDATASATNAPAATQAPATVVSPPTQAPTTQAPTTTAAPAPTVPPTTQAPTPTEPPKPTLTASQKQAVKKAESYLSHQSFSRSGLIHQLEYEGFSNADATFGVDADSVDWNDQAAKKAASYLSHSSFSRASLIHQLEYEGFTTAQATYGVNTTGL